MIDIHNHILYGIDDGCIEYQQSLNLIKDGENEGITSLILTPHFMKNGMYSLKKDDLLERFEYFKQKLIDDQVNVKIKLGNELYIHQDLEELLSSNQIMTLGDSRYILVEFAFFDYPPVNDEILYNLKLDGYKIIIAHPERYNYVKKDPNFCLNWLEQGYLLQVNQQSLLEGRYSLAFKMIRNGFVSFVASDAHDHLRPLTLRRALRMVEEYYGEQIAAELFINNPQKVFDDEEVVNGNYIAFKKGFLNKLL